MYPMHYIYLLISFFILNLYACNTEVVPPETIAMRTWLNSASYPPSSQDEDLEKRQTQSKMLLPDIQMTVWAVGVITGYIGEHLVYYSDVSTMVSLLVDTLGDPPWDNFNWETETHDQARDLENHLSLIAYRSVNSDFYAITGNDFVKLLNHAYYAKIMDSVSFNLLITSNSNLSERVQPLVGYAKEYFNDLRRLSIKTRYADSETQGVCVRAEVVSFNGQIPYIGLAKAQNKDDAMPAMVLASLKATVRCGMNQSNIRDFIYEHIQTDQQNKILVDLFLSHMFYVPHLIYQYIDLCQLPPKIIITLNQADCDSSIFGD